MYVCYIISFWINQKYLEIKSVVECFKLIVWPLRNLCNAREVLISQKSKKKLFIWKEAFWMSLLKVKEFYKCFSKWKFKSLYRLLQPKRLFFTEFVRFNLTQQLNSNPILLFFSYLFLIRIRNFHNFSKKKAYLHMKLLKKFCIFYFQPHFNKQIKMPHK